MERPTRGSGRLPGRPTAPAVALFFCGGLGCVAWASAAVDASFSAAYYTSYYSAPSSGLGEERLDAKREGGGEGDGAGGDRVYAVQPEDHSTAPAGLPSVPGRRHLARRETLSDQRPSALVPSILTADEEEGSEYEADVGHHWARPVALQEVGDRQMSGSYFEDRTTWLCLALGLLLALPLARLMEPSAGHDHSTKSYRQQHRHQQQDQQQQQQQEQQQQQQREQHQQQRQEHIPFRQPGRLAVLDSAKFWMMLAVMLVHWDCCFSTGLPYAEYPLRFLNPWCTRTFALLSGLVSKEPLSRSTISNLAIRVVMPYLLFNSVLSMYVFVPINEHGIPSLAVAASASWSSIAHAENASWYLIALAQWKILSAPFAALSTRTQLAAALGLAAAGGYAGISWLRFDWAIATYPLFVFGQIFDLEEALRMFPESANKKILGLVLLAVLCLLQASPSLEGFMGGVPTFGWSDAEHYQLSGNWREESAYPFFWIRGCFRNLLELTKSLILILLCLPRVPGLTSYFGQFTLYPFLLHWESLTIVTKLFAHVPWTNKHTTHPVVQGILQWLFAVLGLVLLLMTLSSLPVRLLFKPVLEPLWLFRVCPARAGKK